MNDQPCAKCGMRTVTSVGCAYCLTEEVRALGAAKRAEEERKRAGSLRAFFGAFECDGCRVEYGATKTYETIPHVRTHWTAETGALVINESTTLCARCVAHGLVKVEDEELRHRFARHVGELKAAEPPAGPGVVDVEVTDGKRTALVRMVKP